MRDRGWTDIHAIERIEDSMFRDMEALKKAIQSCVSLVQMLSEAGFLLDYFRRGRVSFDEVFEGFCSYAKASDRVADNLCLKTSIYRGDLRAAFTALEKRRIMMGPTETGSPENEGNLYDDVDSIIDRARSLGTEAGDMAADFLEEVRKKFADGEKDDD